jgi:hypothetical protein
MKGIHSLIGVSAALVMLLLAPVAVEAADAGGASSDIDGEAAAVAKADAVARYLPVDVFGVQVMYDPETKQVKAPTPEQAAALSAALKARYGKVEARATGETSVVVRKNGVLMTQLDGSHLNFSTARVQPDGTLQFECAKDDDHASDVVTAPGAGLETE